MTMKKPKQRDVTKTRARAGVPKSHLDQLAAIPPEAASDPLGFADRQLLALIPLAVREKEWQLKFGSDNRRDAVASEILAMKGIAAKRDTAPVIQPAIVLIQPATSPFAQQASRALPVDNAPVVDAQVVNRDGDSQ